MSVAIEMDGKRLQVDPGMNVLEAALQNGIYIPHLCHHPDLPDIGSWTGRKTYSLPAN